jgi:hypothetical protein
MRYALISMVEAISRDSERHPEDDVTIGRPIVTRPSRSRVWLICGNHPVLKLFVESLIEKIKVNGDNFF